MEVHVFGEDQDVGGQLEVVSVEDAHVDRNLSLALDRVGSAMPLPVLGIVMQLTKHFDPDGLGALLAPDDDAAVDAIAFGYLDDRLAFSSLPVTENPGRLGIQGALGSVGMGLGTDRRGAAAQDNESGKEGESEASAADQGGRPG